MSPHIERKKLRRKLKVPPTMEIDEPAELWIMKIARKNYWRVGSDYAFDDLVQDGYLIWYRIVNGQAKRGVRKPGEPVSMACRYKYITERRHIMGLFKSAYCNHITDLANGRTRMLPLNAAEYTEVDMDIPEAETSTFNVLVVQAPAHVKKVLELYIKEDPRLHAEYSIRPSGARETLNERLCRLTSQEGLDLVGAVKEHFNPREHSLKNRQLEELAKKINSMKECGRVVDHHLILKVKLHHLLGALLIEARKICFDLGYIFQKWLQRTCGLDYEDGLSYMRAYGMNQIQGAK